MYDYTGVKNIEDLNLIYQPKDYFNPHKNQYEFKTETDFVEILPDFIGYANGDVVVKVRMGFPMKEYKIRFSLYDSVWVDDYNAFISTSIAMVKDYLGFDSKAWILFLNALRDCNNYADSGLSVETLLPKSSNTPNTSKKVHRVTKVDNDDKNFFSFLNGWFNVNYKYSFKLSVEESCVYSVFEVSDMIMTINNRTLTTDIYADNIGAKTKRVLENLLKLKVGRVCYHSLKEYKEVA